MNVKTINPLLLGLGDETGLSLVDLVDTSRYARESLVGG